MKNDIPESVVIREREYEIQQAITRHKRAIDDGDMAYVLSSQMEGVLANAWAGDESEVGRIVVQALKQYVADLASHAVFGREGVVKVEDV